MAEESAGGGKASKPVTMGKAFGIGAIAASVVVYLYHTATATLLTGARAGDFLSDGLTPNTAAGRSANPSLTPATSN